MAECFFARLGYEDCSRGMLQRMHLIPKQRLRIAGLDQDEIWSDQVWVYGCVRHHHLLDMKALRLTRGQLPSALEDYAKEYDLEWSLIRDYGALAA